MTCPQAFYEDIRVNFTYNSSSLTNISTITYQRLQLSSSFSYLVAENSDIVSSTLNDQGYVDNWYYFTVSAYDESLQAVSVSIDQLQLSVTSDYILLANDQYTNQVPIDCVISSTLSSNSTTQTSTQFTCSFFPVINGSYFLNSPFFESSKSFTIYINNPNTLTQVISRLYSTATLVGNLNINAGDVVEVLIDLRDNFNSSYTVSESDSCSFDESSYSIDGDAYSFTMKGTLSVLKTSIYRSGLADFSIVLSCETITMTLICYKCQKLVAPLTQYVSYQIVMPAYPSTYSLPLTSSVLAVYENSNLVFDIYFYDVYGNQLATLIDPTYGFNFTFYYYGGSVTLSSIQAPGALFIYFPERYSNLVKSLSPRANTYSFSFSVLKQGGVGGSCQSLSDITNISLQIVGTDQMKPLQMVGNVDSTALNNQTATVTWDRLIEAGSLGRLSFVLRSVQMLQLNSWFNSSQIQMIFYDGRKLAVTSNCSYQITSGLYTGEYIGWYNCSYAPAYLVFDLVVNGSYINQRYSPFSVEVGSISSISSLDLYANKTYISGGGGFDLSFYLMDKMGNFITSNLINRRIPQLGYIQATLRKMNDSNSIRSLKIVSQQSNSTLYRVKFDNLLTGNYSLELALPNNLSTSVSFSVISNSTLINPSYSVAYINSPPALGQNLTVQFIPRNEHNESFWFTFKSSNISNSIICSFIHQSGKVYECIYTNESTYLNEDFLYKFTTVEPLTQDGAYITSFYLASSNSYTYVNNGTFKLSNLFNFSASDLYMIKGISQDKFRMLQYTNDSDKYFTFGLLYSQHYDPFIDGTLRFKLYLRSKSYSEILSSVDLTNHTFTANLSNTSLYQGIGQEYIQSTNISNVTFKVFNMNGEYLFVVPSNQSDQNIIDSLNEGYYMLSLTDTDINSVQTTLMWSFSLFNSQTGPQISQRMQVYCPASVNITAGVPYTFVCEISQTLTPLSNSLTSVFSTLKGVEITQSSSGYIFYISIYHKVEGLNSIILLGSNLNQKYNFKVQVYVNPGELSSIIIGNQTSITNSSYKTGESVSFTFFLVDMFRNTIQFNNIVTGSVSKICGMLQLFHSLKKPVIQSCQINTNVFNLTFSTEYQGQISIQNPLIDGSSQLFTVNFTQTVSITPSPVYSFGLISDSKISAGSNLTLKLQLRDQLNMNLTSYNVSKDKNQFSVVLTPENYCNASSQILNFLNSTSNIVYYSLNVTKACTYSVEIYFFNGSDGQSAIPCLNCYIEVQAGAESLASLEFLDSRDALITASQSGQIYLAKYDQRPTLLINFRDKFENQIIQNQSNLVYNYTFMIQQRNTPLGYFQWKSINSFHYIVLCQNSCLSIAVEDTLTLRVAQKNKTTGFEVNSVYLSVKLVSNKGVGYEQEMNLSSQIDSKYSTVRILNQNVKELNGGGIMSIGYDLPLWRVGCMGGMGYPIVGRIHLRNAFGYKVQQMASDVTLAFDSVSSLPQSDYSLTVFDGSTTGTLYFLLFFSSDYFYDKSSLNLTISINGEYKLARTIYASCSLKQDFSKYLLSSNGTLLANAYLGEISAGMPISFNVTAVDSRGVQFLPYDHQISLYQTSSQTFNNSFVFISDKQNKIATISYPFGITGSLGNVSLIGYNLAVKFYFTLISGPISSESTYSYVALTSIYAGNYSNITIYPSDAQNNPFTITSGLLNSSSFSDQVEVFISKLNISGSYIWHQVSNCSFNSTSLSVTCSQQLTQKGLYEWRVVANGLIANCKNCYVNVLSIPSPYLPNSVLTDFSQNYFNSSYGTGQFRFVNNTRSNFYMKLYLKDQYSNAFISDSPVTGFNLTGYLVANTQLNLTLTRILSSVATGSQIYRVSLNTAFTSQFQTLSSGLASVTISSNKSSALSTSISVYLRQLAFQFPTQDSSIDAFQTRTRFSEYYFVAGKVYSMPFEIVDSLGIQLSDYSSYWESIQMSLVNGEDSTYSFGNYILGSYLGIFERLVILTEANTSFIFSNYSSIQLSLENEALSANIITAIVYPGSLTEINYENEYLTANAIDQYNNPVEVRYNQMIGISLLTSFNSNFFSFADYQLSQNYSTLELSLQIEVATQLSSCTIIDTTLNSYTPSVISESHSLDLAAIDYSICFYNFSSHFIYAGEEVTFSLYLFDNSSQLLNSIIEDSDLTLIQVILIHPDQKYNSSLPISSSLEYTLNLSQSGEYYIQVLWDGKLIKFDSQMSASLSFIKVTPLPPALIPSFYIQSIQRNGVGQLSTLHASAENSSFLELSKGQPILLYIRLIDSYGNIIDQTEYYSNYTSQNSIYANLTGSYLNFNPTLTTQVIYNSIIVSLTNDTIAYYYKRTTATVYPLTNSSLNSSNHISLNVKNSQNKQTTIKSFALAFYSKNPIDTYYSSLTNNNQLISSLSSPQLINSSIQLRQNQQQIMSFSALTPNMSVYTSESIVLYNFSTSTNSSLFTFALLRYVNDAAIFRLICNTSTLLQPPSNLTLTINIFTTYTYSSKAMSINETVLSFPRTPPTYLNDLSNKSVLNSSSSGKVSFLLQLKYANDIYLNDYESCNRIKIFLSSIQQNSSVKLVNQTYYSFNVYLQGLTSTYQIRIYYLNFDGSYSSLTSPEVLYISMNSSTLLTSTLRRSPQNTYSEQSYSWLKLFNNFNKKDEGQNKLQASSTLEIQLINNIYDNTYIIGNQLFVSILVLDEDAQVCYPQTEYDPYTDLVITLTRFDIETNTPLSSVTSLQKYLEEVYISQPSCQYYVQLQLQPSYFDIENSWFTLSVSFGLTSSNFTFQSVLKGIDFSKTSIFWLSQDSASEQFIATFDAQQPFSYLIQLNDYDQNIVSMKEEYVLIELSFEGLTKNVDYSFYSSYDSNLNGYIATLIFNSSGTYKPNYYFNHQLASQLKIDNGPLLFIINNPLCSSIMMSSSEINEYDEMIVYQMQFNCFDNNGGLITTGLESQDRMVMFINEDMNNMMIEGAITPVTGGYEIEQEIYLEGTYRIKIYFDGVLLYDGNLFIHQFIENPAFTFVKNSSTSSLCLINGKSSDTYKYCPMLNMCVNTTLTPCCTNPLTPIFCSTKNTCVRYRYQCCEDMTFNGLSLTKCTYENKCVPYDTSDYCFQPLPIQNCTSTYSEYLTSTIKTLYQCNNSGQCVTSLNLCSSTPVCPINYTQCPDLTCVSGNNSFFLCSTPLPDCQKFQPNGSITSFVRCSDGVTCAPNFSECPDLMSCLISGQVLCPDRRSCANTELQCNQTKLTCHPEQTYKCPGFANLCVESIDQCPDTTEKVCLGPFEVLCPDGECSTTCNHLGFNVSTGLITAGSSTAFNCSAQGLVKCPNYECRKNYYECSSALLCHQLDELAFQQNPLLCPHASICATNSDLCFNSHCLSPFNREYGEVFGAANIQQMLTCDDGRCYPSSSQKDRVCMTPFSCSDTFQKVGFGFGQFCISSTSLTQSLLKLSYELNVNECSGGEIKCAVSGKCKKNIYDCPSYITCPSSYPIQCRDGQCVKFKDQCENVDLAIEANLAICLAQGLLLCSNDLISCSNSPSNCPTGLTCPLGYIKCYNERCIDPTVEECSNNEVKSYLEIAIAVSTCPDQVNAPFHCFVDGSCRADLRDCPSAIYCPVDRPVKCLDGSCRSSLLSCPNNALLTRCPDGMLSCPGDNTCVESLNLCGSLSTCPTQYPVMCEDLSCVESFDDCYHNPVSSHFYPLNAQLCVQSQSSVLCYHNKSMCITDDISLCPTISKCPNSYPVKMGQLLQQNTNLDATANNLQCFQTKTSFSYQASNFYLSSTLKCDNTEQFLCSDGTCSSTPCPEWLTCYPTYSGFSSLVQQYSKSFVKCWNGVCKSDYSYCQNIDNGCPYYKPQKCRFTGICVNNDTKTESYCDSDAVAEKALKAVCLEKFNMTVACPIEGNCANSIGDCKVYSNQCVDMYPNTLSINSLSSSLQSDCYSLQCPQELPYKCQGGLCVADPSNCPLLPVTPLQTKICLNFSIQYSVDGYVPCLSGLCVEQLELCRPLYDCSLNTQTQAYYRCSDGSCQQKASDCSQFKQQCDKFSPYYPYMCTNGMCAESLEYCLRNDNGCPEGRPVKCQFNGLCLKAEDSDLCIDPFDVRQNQLTLTNLDAFASNSTFVNNCSSSQYPFSCAAGSCESIAGICPPCPYFCTSVGKCVLSENECEMIDSSISLSAGLNLNYTLLCPFKAPYKCLPTGKCYSNEIDCYFEQQSSVSRGSFNNSIQGSLVNMKCPLAYPIKCSSGECVILYSDCFKSKMSTLISTSFGLSTSESCQVMCMDGSCRETFSDCPLTQGCYDPALPFRCRSGYCAQSEDQCISIFGQAIEEADTEDIVSPSCTNTSLAPVLFKRCEDGVCRPLMGEDYSTYASTCLPYMGCPVESPYHCPNGECATDELQCIGKSQCSYLYPYRCKNFQCVSDIEDCERAYSSYAALQIDRTYYPFENTLMNIAYNRKNQPITKILIPANSIYVDELLINNMLDFFIHVQITPVTDQELENVTNQIAESRIQYLSRMYPLNDDNTLSRGNTLLSPVFTMKLVRTSLVNLHKAQIYFKIDEQTFPSVLNISTDICLGRIFWQVNASSNKPSQWQCVTRQFNETEDGFIAYAISEFGTYGLITNPDPDNQVEEECQWMCQNRVLIKIVVIAGISAIFIFCFSVFICCKKRNGFLEEEPVIGSTEKQSPFSNYTKIRKQTKFKPNKSPAYEPPQINQNSAQSSQEKRIVGLINQTTESKYLDPSPMQQKNLFDLPEEQEQQPLISKGSYDSQSDAEMNSLRKELFKKGVQDKSVVDVMKHLQSAKREMETEIDDLRSQLSESKFKEAQYLNLIRQNQSQKSNTPKEFGSQKHDIKDASDNEEIVHDESIIIGKKSKTKGKLPPNKLRMSNEVKPPQKLEEIPSASKVHQSVDNLSLSERPFAKPRQPEPNIIEEVKEEYRTHYSEPEQQSLVISNEQDDLMYTPVKPPQSIQNSVESSKGQRELEQIQEVNEEHEEVTNYDITERKVREKGKQNYRQIKEQNAIKKEFEAKSEGKTMGSRKQQQVKIREEKKEDREEEEGLTMEMMQQRANQSASVASSIMRVGESNNEADKFSPSPIALNESNQKPFNDSRHSSFMLNPSRGTHFSQFEKQIQKSNRSSGIGNFNILIANDGITGSRSGSLIKAPQLEQSMSLRFQSLMMTATDQKIEEEDEELVNKEEEEKAATEKKNQRKSIFRTPDKWFGKKKESNTEQK